MHHNHHGREVGLEKVCSGLLTKNEEHIFRHIYKCFEIKLLEFMT